MNDEPKTLDEWSLRAWNNSILDERVYKYLRTLSARDIEMFISKQSGEHSRWFHKAKVVLDIRLSEDAADTANKIIEHNKTLTEQTAVMIEESKGLTKLTKALKTLTIVLIVIGIIQCVPIIIDLCKLFILTVDLQ